MAERLARAAPTSSARNRGCRARAWRPRARSSTSAIECASSSELRLDGGRSCSRRPKPMLTSSMGAGSSRHPSRVARSRARRPQVDRLRAQSSFEHRELRGRRCRRAPARAPSPERLENPPRHRTCAGARRGRRRPRTSGSRDSTRVQRPIAARSPRSRRGWRWRARWRRTPTSRRADEIGGERELLEQRRPARPAPRKRGRGSPRRAGSATTPRGSTRGRPPAARPPARTR